MNFISDLANGAWDKLSHLFDGVPSGEPLFWAVLLVLVLTSVASSLSSTGGR